MAYALETEMPATLSPVRRLRVHRDRLGDVLLGGGKAVRSGVQVLGAHRSRSPRRFMSKPNARQAHSAWPPAVPSSKWSSTDRVSKCNARFSMFR